MGSDRLITYLSAYICWNLYGQLMTVDHGMDLLTSNSVLLCIRAASSSTDDFKMCILGHIVGGFIGSLAVDKLVSAFLLCEKTDVFDKAPANRLDMDPLRPGWGGYVSMICWCGIGVEDDNEKKLEVLRII